VHAVSSRNIVSIAALALAVGCAMPVAAQAAEISGTLSSGKVTISGSAAKDELTVDYIDNTSATPNQRYELATRSTTTTWSAGAVSGCTRASATLVRCAASSVSSFAINLGDGDDLLNLRDEDSVTRVADAMTIDLGIGDDILSTSGLCFIFNAQSTCNEFSRGGSWSNPVTASGGDGTDTLNGTAAADTLNGNNGDDTLNGASGNDTLNAGADNDTVNASGGDDIVNGSSGDDTLKGSDGNDTVGGSSGNDTLLGEAGDDTLTPGSGVDTVDGGDGADTASYADRIFLSIPTLDINIVADPVNVSLDGQANDGAAREGDNVGPGIEALTGGQNNDTLVGDDAPNTLIGGSGDDVLRGAGGGDVLDGAAGSDTTAGGAGSDDLRDSGTDGVDTADYSDQTAAVKVDLAGGGSMGPEAEPDVLEPTFEIAVGGAGNDDLTGSAAANTLSGGAGNDVLEGGDGPDTLTGGDGNDKLLGGGGNDSASGDGGHDRVDGGAGSDTKLEGGDGADIVLGGPGGTDDADTLNGGQDRDQLSYEGRKTGISVTFDGLANDGAVGEKDNAGSDFEGVIGGDGPDVMRLTTRVQLKLIPVLIFAPLVRPPLRPLTTATIKPAARAAVDLKIPVEPGRFVMGGPGNDQVFGSPGNDAISGGPGRDKVLGNAGNDAVHGGSDDDEVDGGEGNDRVYGDEGNDLLNGFKGLDLIIAADRLGRDKTICGEDNDTYLRDIRDLLRIGSSCERAVGTEKLKIPETEEPNPLDGDEFFGSEGDTLGDVDVDGDKLTGIEDWADDFGLDAFDSFGAEFDDSFFGFDELGDFGDAGDIKAAIMKLPTTSAKVKKNAFRISLQCPKVATKRCVGEMTISIKPKKGKAKEIGSVLFRATKGKKTQLRFKLRPKHRKLIPKGKKGITARVVVEARDGGDMLFGIDQTVKLRR